MPSPRDAEGNPRPPTLEDIAMCLNCGCGQPDDDHGNEANITMDDLRRAGEANGQDVDQTVANIEKAYHSSADAQGAGTGHQHSF
jgi:hypothetical protein